MTYSCHIYFAIVVKSERIKKYMIEPKDENIEATTTYKFLNQFLQSMQGVSSDYKEEWGWIRYMIGGKMFAAICKDASGTRNILTLKLAPLDGEFLRNQYEDIIPGHYMNKAHWNSIYLDGSVPEHLMKELIEKSYYLVRGGLSKKTQSELENSELENN